MFSGRLARAAVGAVPVADVSADKVGGVAEEPLADLLGQPDLLHQVGGVCVEHKTLLSPGLCGRGNGRCRWHCSTCNGGGETGAAANPPLHGTSAAERLP
jgi:hypothetical protein